MNLIYIKTKNGCYISLNTESRGYGLSEYNLDQYRFNGKEAEKTFKEDWFKIKSIPKKVEKIVAPKRINERFELKPLIQETEDLPKIFMPVKSYIYDEADWLYTTFPKEHLSKKDFYEEKYEMSEVSFEKIDCQFTLLAEIDDFEIKKINHDVKHRFIDEITTHPVLLQEKPCKLSSMGSFKIIRKYIKENINEKYAQMTDSDYSLSVKKTIEKDEPEAYMIDVNYSIFGGRKRKPKMEKRYITDRAIVVFETAPLLKNGSVCGGYTKTEPFEGETYDDMIEKMQKYLKDLINMINEPVVDCPHCKGRGVVLK